MDLPKRLANNLKRRRGELSQVRYARKLGISGPTLNRIENEGQNITLATLQQLCKAIKCDIGDLFT